MARTELTRQERNRFTTTEPYSLERLQKAISLFGNRKPLAKRRLPYANLGEFIATYNLRARSSRSKALDVDIPDDDDDADFQPGRRSARRKRPRQTQSSTEVKSRTVKFSFSSIRGKSLLLQLKHAAIFEDYENSNDDDDDDDEMVDAAPSTNEEDTREVVQDVPTQDYPRGVVRTILTAFAHPIDCELGNNCGFPCDFCTDFAFGMFGLGMTRVEVIDYGTWFEEIDGGHREDGHEPTRMCNVCALGRLHIMNCGGHRLTAIPDFNTRAIGDQAAFNSLSRRKTLRGRRGQINSWCSFCISPAVFRCSTIQIIDIFAHDIADPSSSDAQGCGLLLCQGCKTLMDEHGNDIGRVLAAIPGSMGKRADADFLVNGSDLNRYFSE